MYPTMLMHLETALLWVGWSPRPLCRYKPAAHGYFTPFQSLEEPKGVAGKHCCWSKTSCWFLSAPDVTWPVPGPGDGAVQHGGVDRRRGGAIGGPGGCRGAGRQHHLQVFHRKRCAVEVR